MNLVKQKLSDIFVSNEDVMVGYLSGVSKSNHGCVLYLNFKDPTADLKKCVDKAIPTERIYVDSDTRGFNDLYDEPDLMVGDIVAAVVEDNDPDLWTANKVMKVDRGMLSVFLYQLKNLDPELIKIE